MTNQTDLVEAMDSILETIETEIETEDSTILQHKKVNPKDKYNRGSYLVVPKKEWEHNYNIDFSEYYHPNSFGKGSYIKHHQMDTIFNDYYPDWVVTHEKEFIRYSDAENYIAFHMQVKDLVTGLCSFPIYYPCMVHGAKTRHSPKNPTARQIYDSLCRGKCLVIAKVTGLTYSLWLEEPDPMSTEFAVSSDVPTFNPSAFDKSSETKSESNKGADFNFNEAFDLPTQKSTPQQENNKPVDEWPI